MSLETATSSAGAAQASAPTVVPGPVVRRWPLRGRAGTWAGFALILLLAPLVFSSDLSVSMLSQIGIAIVACLSFNMGHALPILFWKRIVEEIAKHAA